jgi:hypothetical protein
LTLSFFRSVDKQANRKCSGINTICIGREVGENLNRTKGRREQPFRLVSTVNYPNIEKIERGRTVPHAKIKSSDWKHADVPILSRGYNGTMTTIEVRGASLKSKARCERPVSRTAAFVQ